MALVEEVASGDTRRAYVAMRDSLAVAMAAADPNVMAQLAARLQAVIDALDAMPTGEEESVSDDIARRREARRAEAAMVAPAARRQIK